MSLVTRCPACATTFKVVKDQLRISDGWVRCGRCSQVFDATLDLQETPEALQQPLASPPAPATVAGEELPAEVDLADEPALEAGSPPADLPQPDDDPIEPAEAEADFLDDEHDAPDSSPDPEPPSAETAPVLVADEEEPAPEPDVLPAVGGIIPNVAWPDADLLSFGDEGRVAVRPPVPPPLSFPDIDLSLPVASPSVVAMPMAGAGAGEVPQDTGVGLLADDAGNVQFQKALRRARAKSAKIAKARAREQKSEPAVPAPVVLAASEAEPGVAAPAAAMPSFFGDEQAQGFWRRPAVRRSMAALAVLGAVLLAGQIAYQERDLIVARQPSLRPAMVSMCRVLGCEISALRQINDIKVDGASFAREKSDEGYRFSFTLRNAADVPLAMPAVELSLLDTQERAIVRRVLMPADFGGPTVLAARSERAASLSLRLTGPEAAAMPPVAGFRVEALYP